MQRAGTVLIAAWIVAATLAVAAQDRATGDGVYTSAQAMRGATVFQTSCAMCHAADGIAPSLTGERFASIWTDANVNTLFTQVKTAMPRNAPGSLPEAAYVDVVAYLLSLNSFPAGSDELSSPAMA